MYSYITITFGGNCKKSHIPYTYEVWEKLKAAMQYGENIIEIKGEVYAVAHIASILRS